MGVEAIPLRLVEQIVGHGEDALYASEEHIAVHASHGQQLVVAPGGESGTGETDGNHRVTCIDRLVFEKDGTIRPVKITFEGVKATRLK